MNSGEVGENGCCKEVPVSPATVAVVEAKAFTEQHASAQPLSQPRCSPPTNAHAQLDYKAQDNTLHHPKVQSGGAESLRKTYASRSVLLFRIEFVTIYQHGQRSTDRPATPNEGSATFLCRSEPPGSAGVTGRMDPPEINCTTGVTRSSWSMKQLSLAIPARGDGRQYEFTKARSLSKLSLPSQEHSDISLTRTFTHFQGMLTLPSLKGELKLLARTHPTELTAPPKIDSIAKHTTERNRLRWTACSIGSENRKSRIQSISSTVQFVVETNLKQKNVQVRDQTIHTLTDTITNKVMITPCALRDRCTPGQIDLRFCIPQASGREKLQNVGSCPDRQRLIDRLNVGKRKRNPMYVQYERHKAHLEKEDRLPTKQFLYRRNLEEPGEIRNLMRYLKALTKAGDFYIVLI